MNGDFSFLKPISFSTCSYMRRHPGERAKMVSEAISSWADLLDLPFAEKYFLDDRSPDFGAFKLLASGHLLGKFTHAEYCTISHAPHSNFGILRSLELAATPYIMHLDDDVFVTDTADQCKEAINLAIHVMENDPAIMGCNLLHQDPSFHGAEWLSDEPYIEHASLFHPKKYFGAAASVIRRELLDRINFAQIMAWGEKQPGIWEALVTNSPKEFVVGAANSPFQVKRTSYFFSATNEISTRVRFQYLVKSKLKAFLGKG